MKSLYFLFILALGLGLFSTAVGQVPAPSTPKELQSFVASESQRWADIARAAGIEPE